MQSLKGHFLVAAASLVDPNFNRAVVLMLQHDEDGALGVVVNRPLEVTVRQACEQVIGVDCDIDGPLHHGGPCEAVMMVLYPTDADLDDPDADEVDTLDDAAVDPLVVPGLKFTSDKQAIEGLLRDGPPTLDPSRAMKVIVGYSGWSAGQLEGELKSGSWLTVPATAARALGPAHTLWTRLVTEANLAKFVDPRYIPEDPSVN